MSTLKLTIINVVSMSLMTLAVMSLHYVPNHYCVAAFGIPCDITQK